MNVWETRFKDLISAHCFSFRAVTGKLLKPAVPKWTVCLSIEESTCAEAGSRWDRKQAFKHFTVKEKVRKWRVHSHISHWKKWTGALKLLQCLMWSRNMLEGYLFKYVLNNERQECFLLVKRRNTDTCSSLSGLCFVCVCYKHASSVCSGPVKGPNEDVWWSRGGPDAEVDNGLVKISVVQSGCFLWGKTDRIYLPCSVPWPPRDHLKEKDLSLTCKYLQRGVSERRNGCTDMSGADQNKEESF